MYEILDPRLMHPRDQITLVIGRIYKRGMTTTSGGNISVMDENGDLRGINLQHRISGECQEGNK